MISLKQSIFEKLRLHRNIKSPEYFKPKTVNEFSDYINKQKFKVTNHNGTFGSKNNPVDLSRIDFSELLNNNNSALEWYFDDNDELLYVNASEWIIKPNINISLDHFFSDSELIEINVSDWQFNEHIRLLSSMFNGCHQLTEIKGINTWNVEHIIKIGSMFRDCYKLEEIDLSNWKTDSLDRCRSVFRDCTNLKNINLTGWNTKNVMSFDNCFGGCLNLKEIKGIENFDMKKCSNIDDMFCNCSKLNINVNNWTFNITPSMENTFEHVDKKYWPTWYNENN